MSSPALNNLLAYYGYNLIALPKPGVEPLLLLCKSPGCLFSLDATITDLFPVEDEVLPDIQAAEPIGVEISGNASLTFGASGGVTFLNSLLSTFNLGQLKTSFKVDKDCNVIISYHNIVEERISLLQLDKFIKRSKPNVAAFTTFKDKLFDNQLFVLSSVLKSNEFSVSITNKEGGQVELDAGIKDILNANIKTQRQSDNAIVLKAESGIQPFAFAFKAQQIIYDHKSWWNLFDRQVARFRIRDTQGQTLRGAKNENNELNLGDHPVDI